MKIKYFIIIALFATLIASCENELEQPVKFDVKVESADYVTFADSIYVAPVGSKIKFNFTGEPDFISFSYDRFLPTNANLKFSTQAAWGTHIENTLKVLISDSFEGLAMDNYENDKKLISNHNWIDISQLSNLPIAANIKQDATILLNDYRGKNVTFAFRYNTVFADDWQPSWLINDLVIENTRITDGTKEMTILAATMGFSPFDINNAENPYRNEYVSGVWSIVNPAAIQMRQTARGNELNDDWLISKPIEIPKGVVETGNPVNVKNTTLSVSDYTYTFDKVGEYSVTFKASNYNYRHHSSTLKTVKILITD
jgi:hypothetical protein